jgi:hypothetical protein
VLAEWEEALAPMTPIPCRDRLAPLLPLLWQADAATQRAAEKEIGEGYGDGDGWGNVLSIAGVLIDLLDTSHLHLLLTSGPLLGTTTSTSTSTTTPPMGSSSSSCSMTEDAAASRRRRSLASVPHGLSRLTRAVLDHAQLREDQEKVSMVGLDGGVIILPRCPACASNRVVG